MVRARVRLTADDLRRFRFERDERLGARRLWNLQPELGQFLRRRRQLRHQLTRLLRKSANLICRLIIAVLLSVFGLNIDSFLRPNLMTP